MSVRAAWEPYAHLLREQSANNVYKIQYLFQLTLLLSLKRVLLEQSTFDRASLYLLSLFVYEMAPNSFLLCSMACLGSRSGEAQCEAGTFCVGGRRRPCPSGTFGATTGLTSSICSDICPEGSYCPEGSIEPIPCPAGTYGGAMHRRSVEQPANRSNTCPPRCVKIPCKQFVEL